MGAAGAEDYGSVFCGANEDASNDEEDIWSKDGQGRSANV